MAPSTAVECEKTVLVLGGSYGGISTAHYLLKHVIPSLPDKESYKLTLISASAKAMCRPACPRALISDDMFPQDKLFVSVSKGFEQYPKDVFSFIHGRAMELDPNSRTVSVDLASGVAEKIGFHALVIATGACTVSPMFGLNQDVEFLRENWSAFRNALPTVKNITIVGGGPTGIETAGELGEYLNGRAGWFSSKLANPKVPITVYTSDSKILPVLRLAIALTAERYLAKVGVTVVKNTRVASVEPKDSGIDNVATKTTLKLDDGTTVITDLYIPAVGTKPNTSFIPRDLLVKDGRVETNPLTLRVDRAGQRIYAIGDAASYSRPAVHSIMDATPILCANIKRDLLLASGKEMDSVGVDREFKEETRETQFVPIGKTKGVGAAFGWRCPSFLVWLIKGRDYWLGRVGQLWSGEVWAKESR
jgi:NADH dehydrogenase FAD-containing subunit